jgi:hypothetical protein
MGSLATANRQPGPYLLNCVTTLALPGAYAPASIALRVIGACKAPLHDKAPVFKEVRQITHNKLFLIHCLYERILEGLKCNTEMVVKFVMRYKINMRINKFALPCLVFYWPFYEGVYFLIRCVTLDGACYLVVFVLEGYKHDVVRNCI